MRKHGWSGVTVRRFNVGGLRDEETRKKYQEAVTKEIEEKNT